MSSQDGEWHGRSQRRLPTGLFSPRTAHSQEGLLNNWIAHAGTVSHQSLRQCVHIPLWYRPLATKMLQPTTVAQCHAMLMCRHAAGWSAEASLAGLRIVLSSATMLDALRRLRCNADNSVGCSKTFVDQPEAKNDRRYFQTGRAAPLLMGANGAGPRLPFSSPAPLLSQSASCHMFWHLTSSHILAVTRNMC